MKNKGFSAREAIAWMRLCRPGCVIGQQQHFLAACEKMTWDGNFLPVSTALPRRSSSSASGAATPLAAVSKTTSDSLGSFSGLGKLLPSFSHSEELGRQIEQASRARAMKKTKGH
mmetsp:Transcript_35642/g.71425  ORF Transcript_35642/g.71425 Transcript_35642/m.71425 type:complete len:115 (+) Transcript_35642:2-346(+)